MSEAPSAAPAPSSASAESTAPETVETEIDASESEDEGQEEAASEAAAKKTAAALKKKFNLKVNNKNKEIELDLSNDEEIQRYLQKAMAADEKFQEAAFLRKNVEALMHELKTNPRAILQHPDLGIDIKKLAEDVLNEELKEMEMTPEQKKVAEMEKKLKEYEEERKKLEDQAREAEIAKLEEQAFQQLDDQVTEALSTSSLPKSPYVVKRITDAMIEAVGLGYIDVTAAQVMPYVEEQITNEIQRLFEQSPDEVMEKLINKKRLDSYRKSRVAKSKAKAVETAKQVKDTGSKTEAQKKEEEKVTFKQMFGKW